MFGNEKNMFEVSKTINEWLREFRYEWLPGEERLYKAQVTEYEAHGMISDLVMEGAVRKRG